MTTNTTVQLALRSSPIARDFGAADSLLEKARNVFEVLHDRHVPVTPRLATALARMNTLKAPAFEECWGRAFDLASAEVGLGPQQMGYQASWRYIYPVFVQAIVEPLVRNAVSSTGQVNLAVAAGVTVGGSPPSRKDYAVLEREVDRALSEREIMGRSFWIEAGITLLGAYRKQLGAYRGIIGGGRHLPHDPDVRLAQLVYGVEPRFDENGDLFHRAQISRARSNQIRAGHRPREGGVEGVLHTRRFRDIADALISAFLLPKRVRLIRLLEEGFLIADRPPYRRPARDLLSATIHDSSMADLEAGLLVKAAWIDATTRLRPLLAQLQMLKSELGCGEVSQCGLRSAAISMAAMSAVMASHPWRISGAQRCGLISRSSLVPAMFDHIPQVSLKSETELASEATAATLLRHVDVTCYEEARQASKRYHRREIPASVQGIHSRDYAHRCLIHVTPGTVRQDEEVVLNWRADRRDLVRRFQLEHEERVHCGVILCPRELTLGANFRMQSDDGLAATEITVPDTPTSDSNERVARLIGSISAWLVVQHLLAVQNG